MVKEELAEILELRPGRKLFVRHWVLVGGSAASNGDDTNTTTTTSPSATMINLVCVHGTAATQEQFLPVLRAIESSSSESSGSFIIHCWMWDAVGCGKSPKIVGDRNAYSDSANVQDIQALMKHHVDGSLPTYFMGHSYGPQWIYKYLLKTSASAVAAGLILISTGLLGDGLVNRGPLLFRLLPLALLNCLQPTLTKEFLKIGFAPKTHTTQPTLIQDAIAANNDNDMQIVCNYYGNHEWLSEIPSSLRVLPSLVMHGIDDGVIPITHGQKVANQFQKTDLISIPDASHMILLERPDVVSEHVLAFLQNGQR